MRIAMSITAAAITLAALVPALAPAFAHGGESHSKCKKGYVMTDDHKCVKKP